MSLVANLILDWLGVTLAYACAAGLGVAGGYLEFIVADNPLGSLVLGKFLRYLGKVLLLAAVALAVLTFGKGLGLEACANDARLAELRAENARLEAEASLNKQASASALSSMATLARLHDAAQSQIADYQSHAPVDPACRATGDDDRRLRALLQGDAPSR